MNQCRRGWGVFSLANYCDFMARLSSCNTQRNSLQVIIEKEREESGGARAFCLQELKSYKHLQVHSFRSPTRLG